MPAIDVTTCNVHVTFNFCVIFLFINVDLSNYWIWSNSGPTSLCDLRDSSRKFLKTRKYCWGLHAIMLDLEKTILRALEKQEIWKTWTPVTLIEKWPKINPDKSEVVVPSDVLCSDGWLYHEQPQLR